MKVFHNIFRKILGGIITIFITKLFVTGVVFEIIVGKTYDFITHEWQLLILIGIVLGLINIFIKPIMKMISLPFKILTLGILSSVINFIIYLIITGLLNFIFNEMQIISINGFIFVSLINFIVDKFI